MLFYLLALPLFFSQNPASAETLELEAWTVGELSTSSQEVETEALEALSPGNDHLGQMHSIKVDSTGIYHIELRSYYFDSYLILRNDRGEIILEDDDGWMGTHSRLNNVQLKQGNAYQLWTCSAHGKHGWFEVTISKGSADNFSKQKQSELLLEDRIRGIEWMEGKEGVQSPALFVPLKNLVEELWVAGKTEDAIPYAKRAIQLSKIVHGDLHSDTASSHSTLGTLFGALSQSKEAAQQYQKSLAIYRKILPPLSEDIIYTLTYLCYQLGLLNQHQEIIELAYPEYQALISSFDPDDWRTQRLHLQLGPAYFELGEFTKSEKHWRASFESEKRQAKPDKYMLGVKANNLANVYVELRKLKEAADLLRFAFETLTIEAGPDDPNTLSSLGNLSAVLWFQGLYHQAEPGLRQVLEARSRLFGPNHWSTLESKQNLVALFVELDRLLEAEKLARDVIKQIEDQDGSESKRLILPISQLGSALNKLGRRGQALPNIKRALDLAEKHYGTEHPTYCMHLGNLGLFYLTTSQYELAKPILEHTLELQSNIFGENSPRLVHIHGSLGAALNGLDEVVAAHEAFMEAVRIAKTSFGSEDPRTATPLANLAFFLFQQGEFAEAQNMGRKALEIRRKAFSGPTYEIVTNLLMLARNSMASKMNPTAFEESKEALSFINSIASSSLWMMSEADGFSFLERMELAVKVFLAAAIKTNSPETQASALQAITEWKGRIGRSFLGANADSNRNLGAQEIEGLHELQEIQGVLSRMAYRSDVDDFESHAVKMQGLSERKNEIETQLNRARGETVGTNELNLNEIRSGLPENAVLVEFFVHPHFLIPDQITQPNSQAAGFSAHYSLSAWILRPDDPEVKWVDLGSSDDISLLVQEFLRGQVSNRGGALIKEGEPSFDARLKKLLFDPLVEHFGDAHLIFISPDSFLATLPFEILPDENGRFLIEDYSFVYLNGAQQLAQFQSGNRSHKQSLISVGGVDFNGTPPPHGIEPESRGGVDSFWGRLTHTDYESQVIFDMFQAFFLDMPALHLKGSEPHEAKLKKELVGKSFIHLATHGFFEPEGTPSLWQAAKDVSVQVGDSSTQWQFAMNRIEGVSPGLLTGLVCAGANRSEEDGLLTAEEVQWLDLSSADLVVLSACETALGKERSGSGMMSLRRAFHLAGAKTVISSLWNVDDQSTQELMKEFYQNLWIKKQSTIEALRNAQLKLLRRNRSQQNNPLPYTWGAFVLSGNWK